MGIPFLQMRCSDNVDVDPEVPRKLPGRIYKDPLCSARIVPCSLPLCSRSCKVLLCTTVPAETMFLNVHRTRHDSLFRGKSPPERSFEFFPINVTRYFAQRLRDCKVNFKMRFRFVPDSVENMLKHNRAREILFSSILSCSFFLGRRFYFVSLPFAISRSRKG